MSKILANQIANYLDNAPIEVKEGVNIPAGKPLQVGGSSGTTGQVLTTDGSAISWQDAPYFSGAYADLTGKPTIPAAQVNSDWNAVGGVAQILNKPVVPPTPSVTIAPSPSGGGSLVYNGTNGEFTFTQPDLSPYLTTETDPVFLASDAAAVTAAKISNWDTSYSWGNHAAQGYITPTGINVSQLSASGGGSLVYDNVNGTLTYRPPDLSGYLTAEADTLATVTARGAVTTADVTVNDMVVNGNLTVIGTTTSNNQSTLNVAATEIVINDGQTGAPTLNGSLKIDRGDGTDTAIRWNEGTDTWEFTNNGTNYNPIPTNTNQLTNGAGFLTSYTETDPVFSGSPAGGITNTNITNWNTAYGWGNHATAGYLTAEADTLATITARGATTTQNVEVGALTVNGNLTVTGTTTTINTVNVRVSDNEITLNNDVTGTPTENAGIEVERGLSTNVRIRWDETSDRWTFTNNGTNYYNFPINISDLPNDSGYISSYTETDPIFSASAASGITTQNLTNWNSAYNWGNHATAGYLTDIAGESVSSLTDVNVTGASNNQLLRYNSSTSDWENWTPNYLTSYTETDPVFVASPSYGITNTNIGNWNTAFSWGNHAAAGYLTGITSESIGDLSDVNTSTTPTNGDALVWNGTNWAPAAVTSSGGGATVTTDDAAPTSPSDGDLWWKSDEGRLKVYYQDADSSQWVDASPPLAVTNPNIPVAVGCITLNGTSPTWSGTSGYSVSGSQPGGAGTDYVITLTFPSAYSARTDYIVQATYDSTNYVSGNGASIGVARGTASVVFTPRRWDENPLSLGEIMVTITNF
ncbi:tail fiber-like protein [Synechococcus phage S-H9-1]|uniref:Tail fiber-like protein n=1 Tax=Synechococcus phage S-H9-1 TaxID=2783674 RepID=A0A873WGU2_9CAUD|nr:tail fiber-like protein [Synechococcus phage S-H9-1]QPB08162.1 tail fiber-like protein [Synechococcus phage S-H9-1]